MERRYYGKMISRRIFILIFIYFLQVSLLNGAVWEDNSGDQDWTNASNWDTGVVPGGANMVAWGWILEYAWIKSNMCTIC